MLYRVILLRNGEYVKTLHRCKTRETIFLNYNKLLEKNKEVKFPKKYINSGKIKQVKYKICVTKPTEPDDVFRTVRDDFGKTYIEKPIGEWTILASENYNIEEKFWIYGMNSKKNRPTIQDVVNRLVKNAYKKKLVKQVIVVHNKLIIYSEEQFDMILCKCMADAQRLHHVLARICKKKKIKNLLFMGTATQATVSRMYEIIHENTGWPLTKIRRTTTRP